MIGSMVEELFFLSWLHPPFSRPPLVTVFCTVPEDGSRDFWFLLCTALKYAPVPDKALWQLDAPCVPAPLDSTPRLFLTS